MTDHTNDERTVRCPVDGCEATPLARGINLHLMRSSGNGHGPQGEVPDHISTDDLETVGTESVQMDYPEERETEQVARLCPYCSTPYKGTNGVLIHLGQVAGRKNHPEDAAKQHDESDFPVVEVDERGNIISVVDDSRDTEISDTDKGAVSKQQVYHLIADFMANGDAEAAARVRRKLLGIEIENRALSQNPSHDDVFSALVTYAQAGQTDHSVTAALESEGIMVACRGESAFYNAEEARDVAAGLERATSEDPRHGTIADLIAFLRYGANVLDENHPKRGLHVEFGNWR
ncbi:hypothetical protein [Natronomonas amylolytica]|uniref:hypothetical protein n=1 Tax=Natronomonas amylolytica TaxID=3108498 RepID=UPI0030090B7E